MINLVVKILNYKISFIVFRNMLKKTRRFLNQAEEILNFNYGPWNNACHEIAQKQQNLVPLLANLNL